MSNPDRIYLEPDHAQIEGRMWCQDDDPASLGEPWTEYVRADLVDGITADLDTMREDRDEHFESLVESAERTKVLEAERNRYREALEDVAEITTHDGCYPEGYCLSDSLREKIRHALNREK